MIQRCNIHQRDVLHAVVAAQTVDQRIGGIHGGDAGDAELHGLADVYKRQAQIITPFMRVRTYLTRNFATLGPL